MTGDAHSRRAGPEHLISGLADEVIPVADFAFGQAQGFMGGLVGTFGEEVSCQTVALGADIANRDRTGPGSLMRAMTTSTVRSRPVAPKQERLSMDALRVLPMLSDRQPVSLHERGIGVTTCAGSRDVRRKHRRQRILF